MFSDRILALRDGRVLTEGRPRDVLTSDTMRRLFQCCAAAGTRYLCRMVFR